MPSNSNEKADTSRMRIKGLAVIIVIGAMEFLIFTALLELPFYLRMDRASERRRWDVAETCRGISPGMSVRQIVSAIRADGRTVRERERGAELTFSGTDGSCVVSLDESRKRVTNVRFDHELRASPSPQLLF